MSNRFDPSISIDLLNSMERYTMEYLCFSVPWMDAKEHSPSKDIPILVVSRFNEMLTVVIWLEEGAYGYPGFFESNAEYGVKLEDILYWFPAPDLPNCLLE